MLTRLLFALAFCSLLWGQDQGVPVVIDGREVARVYAPVGSFTAAERAPEIEHRIVTLAEKGYAGKIETRSVPSEQSTAIAAGQFLIMAVTKADAQSAGVPQDELARRYAAAIQKAIGRYRAERTFSKLLKAVTKTAIAWTLFSLSIWSFWHVIRWLSVWIEQRFSRRAEALGAQGFHLLLWGRGRMILIGAVKFAVLITLLAEFSFVLSFTFGLFPQTAGVSTTLWDYLAHTFESAGLAVVAYLPSGGFVIITVWLTRYLLKVLKFLAMAVENGDLVIKGMHREMAKPTLQLARTVVILFALILVFPYLPGGRSDAFKGVSIILGVLLSLGSSSAIGNVLAGLVLTYMRPFHAGDRVKIADTTGDVLEKALLVTRLHTIKNVEVVIPNSSILSNQIFNYSALARTRGLILHTTVTIGYNVPWRMVHELLIRAALSTDGILDDPAPFVLETSLNDFHISYELNAYTDRAQEIQNIYSRLHEGIQDSFNKEGVEIMSPSFYALRDGNGATTPEDHLPRDYVAPAFRVNDLNGPRGNTVHSSSKP